MYGIVPCIISLLFGFSDRKQDDRIQSMAKVVARYFSVFWCSNTAGTDKLEVLQPIIETVDAIMENALKESIPILHTNKTLENVDE